jgi:hypothetical protein
MPNVTYEELLSLARSLEGQPLTTVKGREFTVGVSRTSELVFTPVSSGYAQSDGRKAAERFLVRYNETGSLRPSDYADVSRNASYIIGLLIAASEMRRP